MRWSEPRAVLAYLVLRRHGQCGSTLSLRQPACPESRPACRAVASAKEDDRRSLRSLLLKNESPPVRSKILCSETLAGKLGIMFGTLSVHPGKASWLP